MRVKEGAELVADLRKRVAKLVQHLEAVKAEVPHVTTRYREALRKRLAEAGITVPVDDPMMIRELAVFADRSDITEEITRLDSHVKQIHSLFKSAEPAGRTLDFLAQEMFRELNTLGSKANDTGILEDVVALKAELERIREQVQNIE
jgi:uncharacterized protein (TIGR00255 family)